MAFFCATYENNEKYSAVVYAVSSVNPVNHLSDVISEIKRHISGEGYILFDLLLSNGDNFNRFAEAYFDGATINLNTVSIVEVKDEEMLIHFNDHYKGRAKELNESVLSPSERFKYATAKL